MFLAIREPYHNKYVAKIWNSVTFIELTRIGVDRPFFGRTVQVPNQIRQNELTLRLVRRLVDWVKAPDTIILNKDELIDLMFEGYRAEAEIPSDVWERTAISDRPPILGIYATFKSRQDTSDVLDTSYVTDLVLPALQAYTGCTAEKRCYLYLKGDHDWGGGDFASGAGTVAWLPQIRKLVDLGYVVLITGDCPVMPAQLSEFGNKAVTADTLGVDRFLFSAFAATESEIMLGDNGGGVQFGHIRRIPRLIVNIAPPECVWADAYMMFKHYDAPDGTPIHYTDVTQHYWGARGKYAWKTIDNTADEIDLAVDEFLGDPLGKRPISKSARVVLDTWPDGPGLQSAASRPSEVYAATVEARNKTSLDNNSDTGSAVRVTG